MNQIVWKFLLLIILTFFCTQLTLAQDEFIIIPDTTLHMTDVETDIPVEIKISKFMIAKTEVTQNQFEKIMGYNPSFYNGDNKPVERVSWWEAIQYCNKRSIQEGLEPCYDLSTGMCDFTKNGYRLPTNTEWSIANSYDEDLTQKGNFGVNNVTEIQLLVNELEDGTNSVAQYESNRFGLYDMLGNVWEWVYDFYDYIHRTTPASLNNPIGNSWGLERTIRGGSFVGPGASSWNRKVSSMKPENSSRFTGFRVVRSLGSRNVTRNIEDSSEWFEHFNQAPKEYRDNLGQLSSLLLEENGVRINSPSKWEIKKEEIKEKWENLLGEPSIDSPPEVNVKVIKTFDEDIYWGKLMYLQVEPDFWEKIYIMIPKKPIRSPTPVLITPYYDVDVAAGKNMGGRRYSPKDVRHFSYLAVQHGYIAVAARWFGESYGEGYAEAVANLYTRHPDLTGIGKWVWDVQRIIDYLYTLPNVDRDHIGIMGHSMASKMALYGAAMDERISVAVMSEGGISLKFANYDAYWYFGDYIRDIQNHTDQHELLGILAPRPLLLIGGAIDTNESWHYINAGREIYNLYNKKNNIGFYNHATGHSPTPKAVNLAFEWLDYFFEKK